ncbi:uncharacterized protein LOC124127203 [Haliotis rufescens]|uniref:uncharacterized protein LOC124127203 n=1 Tax=Haliotis rufescens TaxID=6454 RepID=UPI00201FA8D2|nr:uncharacterized protein LOC124127203 [Haliotis rufescens]
METDPNLHIQHAKNGVEKMFMSGEGNHHYRVNGYDPATGTMYEFMGSFWYGCCSCCKTKRGEPHAVLCTVMGARYTNTHYRLGLLKQHPDVKRIVTLWECDFKAQQLSDPALLAFMQGPHCTNLPAPLNPRDAFHGGRTNATRLCYEAQEGETIKYIDICSLYPYICKTREFPTGHPTLYHQPPVEKLFDLKGLIHCHVLLPTHLYHPLLPYRSGGKLLTPLCRTCAETRSQTSCEHTGEERAWVGTYTTTELHEAVKKYGYKVL